MTKVDGLAVTFTMNLAYLAVEKPQGYNADAAAALLESYDSGNEITTGDNETLPNLIVVMDESFADLSVLGDFSVSEDPTPFLHSLMAGADNTISGTAHVSVCGGNTPNSEFEFLTGNTMAFLPQGSVPYQQYITGEIPSLAQWLSSLGYETVAAHPYNASGWERETVYPLLGFSESLFYPDFSGAKLVRNYVSDESCVKKLISLYEEKSPDAPLFAFLVTMQNHGGYTETYDNFTPDVVAAGINSTSLDQYLSLTKKTDEALEMLLSYFAEETEPTVVVFFGDHQPYDTVAEAVLAKNGLHYNTLDEEQTLLRYQVPYVIWANYEIPSQTDVDTSLNYLSAEVCAAAGIPTNAYQNFLLELRETYPVISAVEQPEDEASLSDYRKLQYYELFDQGGLP
jgi:phosphoglycerol transferase MdoB-like AlkP superfamily enzyme